jgi:hypothetical protein
MSIALHFLVLLAGMQLAGVLRVFRVDQAFMLLITSYSLANIWPTVQVQMLD